MEGGIDGRIEEEVEEGKEEGREGDEGTGEKETDGWGLGPAVVELAVTEEYEEDGMGKRELE